MNSSITSAQKQSLQDMVTNPNISGYIAKGVVDISSFFGNVPHGAKNLAIAGVLALGALNITPALADASMVSGGYNNTNAQVQQGAKSINENPEIKYAVEQAVGRYANSYNNYMDVSAKYLNMLEASELASSVTERNNYNKKIRVGANQVADAEAKYYDSKDVTVGVLDTVAERGYNVSVYRNDIIKYSDIDVRASEALDKTDKYATRIGKNQRASEQGISGDVNEKLKSARNANNTLNNISNTIRNTTNTVNRFKQIFK